MQKPGSLPKFWWAVSGLTFLILLLYSYAYLVITPYLGLRIQFLQGEITFFTPQNPGKESLQNDDTILLAGDLDPDVIRRSRDSFLPLFYEYGPGDLIDFQVQRGDQILDVEWTVPGPTFEEVWNRLFYLWWMAYIFWGFGVFTLAAVWIRDERWRLLVWFNNLAAVWIVTGVASISLVFYSSLVMHAITWLLMAVMLHLHWIFPRPFEELKERKDNFITLLYILAFALAVAEIFQLLPWSAYMLALALALGGSLGLLALHYWLQPDSHWAVRVVVSALIMVMLGGVVFYLLGRMTDSTSLTGVGVLFAPLIPAAYFYAIMRRRMGVYEALLNRLVVVLVYAILLLATIMVVFFLLTIYIDSIETRLVVSMGMVVMIAGLGLFFYGSFQRLIEQSYLGIQQSIDELVQDFGRRLVTRLSFEQLISLLAEEVMPSLGIHQGALVKLVGFDGVSPPADVEVLDSTEMATDEYPKPEDVLPLLEQSKRYRPPPEEGILVQPCPWVRLVLPMLHEGKTVGMCLLGSRDPDDFYSQTELPTLQALVDQTSLALSNIEQANLLLALSRRSIAHREAERLSLAHELHDEVLAQMAVLAQSMSEPSDAFIQAYQDAVQRIRDVISGLRPATLEQLGLHTALEELLDDLTERSELMNGVGPALALNLNPERRRYDPEVELHLYRIVQQACYNVLEHAHAQKLSISGRLCENEVELEVVDNGIGFPDGGNPDMVSLLARQHFGLVTMHERASLIGALVKIESIPGEGTRVKVTWRR